MGGLLDRPCDMHSWIHISLMPSKISFCFSPSLLPSPGWCSSQPHTLEHSKRERGLFDWRSPTQRGGSSTHSYALACPHTRNHRMRRTLSTWALGGVVCVKSNHSSYPLQCVQTDIPFFVCVCAPVMCWSFSSGHLVLLKGYLIQVLLSNTLLSWRSLTIARWTGEFTGHSVSTAGNRSVCPLLDAQLGGTASGSLSIWCWIP